MISLSVIQIKLKNYKTADMPSRSLRTVSHKFEGKYYIFQFTVYFFTFSLNRRQALHIEKKEKKKSEPKSIYLFQHSRC